jgi:DNA-binding transcriptional LysR family regulator
MELHVTSGWSLDLVRQMKEQRLDAVFGPFAPGWQPPLGLYGNCLGHDTMVLACPPGARLPKVLTLTNLVDLPWILNAEGCGTRRAMEMASAETGGMLVPAVEATGDFGVLLDFVAAGLGVTLAPELLVRQHPSSASIEVHRMHDTPMGTAFWLCWREPSPPIRPFLESLERALASAFPGLRAVP